MEDLMGREYIDGQMELHTMGTFVMDVDMARVLG